MWTQGEERNMNLQRKVYSRLHAPPGPVPLSFERMHCMPKRVCYIIDATFYGSYRVTLRGELDEFCETPADETI